MILSDFYLLGAEEKCFAYLKKITLKHVIPLKGKGKW